MKIYTVHIKQDDLDPIESAIFIKEGFSWFGVSLYIIWTIINRMWLTSFILFILTVALNIAKTKGYLSEEASSTIEIGLLLFLGFTFNDLYRNTLERKGYILQDVIAAKNKDEAKYKFIEYMLQRSTFVSGKGSPSLL